MAEQRIVTCDRCGGTVEADLVRLRVATGRSEGETIGLHVECYGAFRAWLRRGNKRRKGASDGGDSD